MTKARQNMSNVCSAFAHSEARSDSQGFRYPIPLKIGRDWIYIIIIHLPQKNPIHNFPGWLSLPFWGKRKRIQFRRSEHAKQCSEIQSLKMHSLYQKNIITDGCLLNLTWSHISDGFQTILILATRVWKETYTKFEQSGSVELGNLVKFADSTTLVGTFEFEISSRDQNYRVTDLSTYKEN